MLTLEQIIIGAINEEMLFRFSFFLPIFMFADNHWKDDIHTIIKGNSSYLTKNRYTIIFLITSSCFFCAVHIFFHELFSIFLFLNWYIYYFIGGLILGLIFLRFGLFMSIFTHGFYNLLVVIIFSLV